MNYYAFIPREDGSAPMGTANKVIIRDLKTLKGAIKQASNRLGSTVFCLYSYHNFYDNSTFSLLHNSTGKTCSL